MVKRWTIKERMCLRKLKYGETRALREAKRRHMRPYLCPLCRSWHLTRTAI